MRILKNKRKDRKRRTILISYIAWMNIVCDLKCRREKESTFTFREVYIYVIKCDLTYLDIYSRFFLFLYFFLFVFFFNLLSWQQWLELPSLLFALLFYSFSFIVFRFSILFLIFPISLLSSQLSSSH